MSREIQKAKLTTNISHEFRKKLVKVSVLKASFAFCKKMFKRIFVSTPSTRPLSCCPGSNPAHVGTVFHRRLSSEGNKSLKDCNVHIKSEPSETCSLNPGIFSIRLTQEMLQIRVRRAPYHFIGSGSELSIVDPNPDPDSAYYCGKIIFLNLSSWDFLQKPISEDTK